MYHRASAMQWVEDPGISDYRKILATNKKRSRLNLGALSVNLAVGRKRLSL